MKTIKTYKFSQGDKDLEFFIQGGDDEIWLTCSQGDDSFSFYLDIDDMESIRNDINDIIFKFKNQNG
jgi:hypothetical protein